MLNGNQEKFIPLLIETGSIDKACQGVDIGRPSKKGQEQGINESP
jgi:hypothetical protein